MPLPVLPFTRDKLSMHIQLICETWHDPKRRDDPTVGARVDDAHRVMATWAAWAHQPQTSNKRSPP